jgi:hypothetical protein
VDIAEFKGKTLVHHNFNADENEITFTFSDGSVYRMYHDQDCCESVTVEEIIGDMDDLIGSPILEAEEATNADSEPPQYAESFTWTFYKLGTIKGHVNIRWLGMSNGYYSESVNIARVE